MRKSLIDSDILSEISKGVDPNVLRQARTYLEAHATFTITSFTVYECLWGYLARPAPAQAARFLRLAAAHDEIVPTREDYRLDAEIRAALKLRGRPIGKADPVVAACAIRRDLALITGNTRHYAFIIEAGFALETADWRVQQPANYYARVGVRDLPAPSI